MKKHGFTLVELVVVLAVIAILTHLAVRELSHLRDAKLTKAADAQLETIRTSVFTPSGKRHIAQVADEEATGFLADMGRLPRLVDDMTLGELWTMPTNALPYAVRPATAENLVPGLSSLANTSVYVPTGWRGPYLRLPIGKSRLFDPWGNPVEREDAARLPRLTISNDFIVAVSHYGPRAQREGIRTLSIQPDGGAASRLIVSTTSASDISVAWYGPAGGLITGATHTVSAAVPYTFEGLPPGTRILHYNGAAHTIDVKPGDNLISIDLP